MAEKTHRNETLVSWAITAGLTIAFLMFLKLNVTQTFELFEIPFSPSIPTWRAAVFFVSIFFIGLYAYKIGLDFFGGSALALIALVGASTLYNQGDMMVWARDWLRCFATLCAVGACARTRLRELLRAFFVASSFYLICDLIYIFQSEHGLYFKSMGLMFFGNHTETFKIAIPAFICSAALDSLDGRRFSVNTCAVFGLGIVDLLVGCSVNALTVLIMTGVLSVLVQSRRIRNSLNGVSLGIFFCVADLLMVGLRIYKLMEEFIVDVLHKTATLSGREWVWDSAVQALQGRHLLTGYGCSYGDGLLQLNGCISVHAHNEVLHMVLSGGLLAGVCWFLLLCIASLNLYRCRANKTVALVAAGLFGFLIIGIFEITTTASFFFLLAIAYYGFRAAPLSIDSSNKSNWRRGQEPTKKRICIDVPLREGVSR